MGKKGLWKKRLLAGVLSIAMMNGSLSGITGNQPVYAAENTSDATTSQEDNSIEQNIQPETTVLLARKSDKTNYEVKDKANGLTVGATRVLFLTFDLTQYVDEVTERSLEKAIFTVEGKRESGGADQKAIIKKIDTIVEEDEVPTLTMQGGNSQVLTYNNLYQVSGTVVTDSAQFYRIQGKSAEIDLTKSLKAAIRNNETKVTYMIYAVNYEGTGCDIYSNELGEEKGPLLTTQTVAYTDARRVADAIETLNDKYTDCYTTTNLELPTNDINGASIQWESSNPEIVSADGTVNIPETSTEVTMSATVSYGEIQENVSYKIVVSSLEQYYVDQAIKKLNQQFSSIMNGTIKEDIVIPSFSEEEDHVTVTWESSNENYMTAEGKITRPEVNEEDQAVTLTATITSATDSEKQEQGSFVLNVTIAAKEDTDQVYEQVYSYLTQLKVEQDQSIRIQDYTLPSKMEETDTTTTVVSWDFAEGYGNNEFYTMQQDEVTGDYNITVKQPGEEESDVVVKLIGTITTTGKTTGVTAVESYEFTVYIPKIQTVSPFEEDNLRRLVTFGNRVYEAITTETASKDAQSMDEMENTNLYEMEQAFDADNYASQDSLAFLYYPSKSENVDGHSEITQYSRITVQGTTEEQVAGLLDQGLAEQWKQALEEGEAALKDQNSSFYKSYVEKIKNTGKQLFESANIDNTIMEDAISTSGTTEATRGNKLAFSEIRKELVAALWEAKVELITNVELYPLSAKRALAEQIEDSENALIGTYDYPMNRYREFRQLRDDDILEFCKSHEIRFRSYDSTLYGLVPILDWYRQESVIGNAYYNMTIPVQEAVTVNESQNNQSVTDELTVGTDSLSGLNRFALVKFDLSTLPGAIQSASLSLTSKKSDSNLNNIYLETNDWESATAYTDLQDYYHSYVYIENLSEVTKYKIEDGSYVEDPAGTYIYNEHSTGTTASEQYIYIGKVEEQNYRKAQDEAEGTTIEYDIQSKEGYVADDNGTYSKVPYILPKYGEEEIIAQFKPAGNGVTISAPVTKAAITAYLSDKTLSLRITGATGTRYPNGYVGIAPSTYTKDQYPALNVTMDLINTTQFEANCKEVLEEKKEFLDSIAENTVTLQKTADGSYNYEGAAVGQYPKDLYDQAIAAWEQLNTSTSELYQKAAEVVNLLDAVRILRDHKILQTDIDPEASLFLTEDEVNELQASLETNTLLKEKYEEIKQTADSVSLEELQAAEEYILTNNVTELEKMGIVSYFTIGSGSNAKTIKTEDMKLVSGSADQVAKARIEISLPSGNYKGNGIENGYYAWVKDIVIKNSSSVEIEIPSLDQQHWTFETNGTDAVGSFSEDGGIYLENPSATSNGQWNSELFDITPGSYSLNFGLKQHVVFKDTGVIFRLRYYDANGKEIGYSDNYCNNFKSNASFGAWSMRFQSDAIMYMLTEEETYAEKAKIELLLGSADFAQGADHWMYNTSRPYGIDAYGAVQGGRFTNCLATAYSLVKNSSVWTEEERQQLIENCRFIMQDLTDIRDRSERTAEEVAEGTTNWNTDMAIGSAMLALAFHGEDGWDYANQLFENGKLVIEGQLAENIYHQDGAWNESIRYHNAAISKICVFAKAIRFMSGENWFDSESNIDITKSLFYDVLSQTPTYYYTDNIATPVYGDHVITNGNEFAYCGLYFNEVANVDPLKAYALYQTWKKAGSPMATLSGDNNMMENFFSALTFDENWLTSKGKTIQEAEEYFNRISSTDMGNLGVDTNGDAYVTAEENANVTVNDNGNKGYGIMVFRNNFNQLGKESFLSMIANEYHIAHNHCDQLGIQLFANNTPLVIDPGIGGYWDLSKELYSLSGSHGLVQFAKSNHEGYEQTSNASTVEGASQQKDFYSSDNYDFMSASTQNPNSANGGTLTRSIGFYKDGFEAYIMWDQIKGASYGSRYNLPLFAKETPTIEGNTVYVKGFNNTNLNVTFLEGPELPTEHAFETFMLPTSYLAEKRNSEDAAATVDVLHVPSNTANQNYLTVLFPNAADSSSELKSEAVLVDANGVSVYRLTYVDSENKEKQLYVATNNTDEAKTVALPTEQTEQLQDLKSNVTYNNDSVEIGANTLAIYEKKEVRVMHEVRIEGGTAGAGIEEIVTTDEGIITGKAEDLTKVTVKANPSDTAQEFQYWTVNGNIASYDEEYTFFITCDAQIKAVYGEQTPERNIIIQITNRIVNTEQKKISFVAERNIPNGNKVIEHGIIVATKELDEDTFQIGTSGVKKGKASTTGLTGTYRLNISNVPDGRSVYARGYLIYQDQNGEKHTLYSEISKGTME